jgi:hypothetical protein
MANPTGRVLEVRPPKDVDLMLIALLPIDVLVVHTSTAAAIREKVGALPCGSLLRGMDHATSPVFEP